MTFTNIHGLKTDVIDWDQGLIDQSIDLWRGPHLNLQCISIKGWSKGLETRVQPLQLYFA